MAIYLQHVEGSKKGRVESFDLGRIRIGRLPNNDLRFDLHKDREVSGNHAEIYRQGKNFLIADLDSTNGTYVNGQRIEEPMPISDGDVIEFSSQGPKVIFFTKEPAVESMETLSIAAPSIGTLVIEQDQLAAGLGVGTKTLGRMYQDALVKAKSSQTGPLGTTSRFVQELLKQASSHSSRRMRLTVTSLVILLVLIPGGLIYIAHERRKELEVLAERTKQQQEIIAKQQAELEKARALPEELKRKGIEAQETERGVSVNLPNVLFEVGRSQITSDGEEKIRNIASVLRDSAPSTKVAVEGHASRESGTPEKLNQKLSEDRARNVAEALTKYGIPKGSITVRGLGSSRPLAANETAEGRQQNRRVEVIIEREKN